MKKQDYLKRNASYHNYAISIDVHVKATKGINSGAHGNDFERQIKLALNNYRFNGVAKAGKTDTVKKVNGKRLTFEIKSGCGELTRFNLYGECIGDIRQSEYIIYCPIYDPTQEASKQAFVFETETFYNLMENNDMLRLKKSSYMLKQNKDVQFYDRISIQTFINSKKRLEIMNSIMQHGVPLNVILETWKTTGVNL